MSKHRKKKIFLTPERKAYYQQQMEISRHVPGDDMLFGGWRMDARLEDDMERINQFDCLQTMTSRLPSHPWDNEMPGYLQVAYSRGVARRALTRFIPLRGPGMRIVVAPAHSYDAARNHGELARVIKDIPEAYDAMDMIHDPVGYNTVENVMTYFAPDSTDPALDAAWQLIISTWEAIGLEHEGEKEDAA